MPNHIKNQLTIGSRVQEVRDFIKGDDRAIDFNKIEPMPEILESIISGYVTIKGEDVKNPLTKDFPINSVKLIPSGFKGERMTEDGVWFCHTGQTIKDGQIRLVRPRNDEDNEKLKQTGSASWYDWSIVNWGTKWNAYDVVEVAENVIEFQTAWSGVTKLMEKLSARFPDVEFGYEYADEDTGSNCATGTIIGGVATLHYPETGSVEAYELAFKLWPDCREYYVLKNGKYTCNL